MDRLCFGTFTKVLQASLQEPNSNQAVVGLLLDMVTDEASDGELNENFAFKPKMATKLLNFEDNVHKEIVTLSSKPKVMTVMPGKFAKKVVPYFIPVLIDDFIENMIRLIKNDKSISKVKNDELIALADKNKLADFLAAVYLYALNKPNREISGKTDVEVTGKLTSLDDIALLNEIYAKIAKPESISIPSEPTDEEMEYISQLLAAYAEATGVPALSRDEIDSYPQYKKDLRQRRKEYYAAETIRRGTREVFKIRDPDQFEILKEETYDGIFDVHAQDYKNGYDRLINVMMHVSGIQINKCQLSKLPEWIGTTEKKGVCHILVNDGTISWVVRDE